MQFHTITPEEFIDIENKLSKCKEICRTMINKIRECRYSYLYKFVYDNFIIKKLSFVIQINEKLKEFENVLYYKPGNYVFEKEEFFETMNLLNETIININNLVIKMNNEYFIDFLKAFWINIEKEFYKQKFISPNYLILTEKDLINHIDKDYFETIKDLIRLPVI